MISSEKDGDDVPSVKLHKQNTRPSSPEDKAGFLSRLTYSYFDKLLFSGYKKPLEYEDLHPLSEGIHSENLHQRFKQAWKQEVERVSQLKNHEESSSSPKSKKPSFKPEPSLYRVLWKMFAFEYLWSALAAFVGTQAQVLAPLVMQQLIIWIDNTSYFSRGIKQTNDAVGYGYEWAVLLFIIQVFQTINVNLAFEKSMRIGNKLRSTLICAMYQKSLKLTYGERSRFTFGNLVNIMSSDISRLDFSSQFFNFVWTAPLQVITAFGLLIWQLQESALVGLAVILITIPFQLIASKSLGKYRKKASAIADERIKVTQELMGGIKVVKLYAWENPLIEKLESIRKRELGTLVFFHGLLAAIVGVLQTTPIFAAIASFMVYESLGNQLTEPKAFTCLAFFYALRIPLLIYPTVVARTVDSYVALGRISKVLNADELMYLPGTQNDSSKAYAIECKSGDFIWEGSADIEKKDVSNVDESGEETKVENSDVFSGLFDIEMKVKKGSLTAVVGNVGSGKSSLLSALVGEMKQTSGSLEVNGSIAYCAQAAWIQNLTIKDNIIFGADYNEEKYMETVRVCDLTRDFEILVSGDQTEIGEKGINLSGGQKQRVNLARAVYADRDIILMDDPLSAVDSHVGAHLFEECILGKLGGKTRVLVTHRLNVLPKVDEIIIMDNGRIIETGKYKELMSKTDGVLPKLMAELEAENETADDNEKATKNPFEKVTAEDSSVNQEKSKGNALERSKLIAKEDRLSGQVDFGVYSKYIVLCGGWLVFIFICFYMAINQGSRIATDLWLNYWVHEEIPGLNDFQYRMVYLGLGFAQAFFNVTAGLIIIVSSMRASKSIHSVALRNVLEAPMAWFDSQPIGRLMNRFSRDMDTMDTLLVDVYRVFLYTFFMTMSIFVLISALLPIFLAGLVPVLILYYYIQKFYRKSSVELKRLDLISRSPLLALFTETFTASGIATIRAYGDVDRFMERVKHLLNRNNRSYYISIIIQRWISLRLESLASLLILLVSILGVALASSIDPGLIGLSITYSLQVTFVFNWSIKQWTEMEMYMSSVERLKYYSDSLAKEVDELQKARIDQENNPSLDTEKDITGVEMQSLRVIPKDWPVNGQIKFKDVTMRYRSDLGDVLRNVTFEADAGSKVGIVGRTGAGKSSLINALFRLTGLRSGEITIDDVDISILTLRDLRKRLSIIPQEPFVFSGDIRMNLDPFNEFSDEDIWKCLNIIGLNKSIDENKGLSMEVSEGGENWSAGQRQLICLARAMLKHSKILVLDEATASVDINTDSLIQKSLREHFKNCTILTIAHRINTIMDYDKIIVMDKGSVVEDGSPAELMSKKGMFYGMANQQGITS